MNEMVERVALAISGSDDPSNILTIHRDRARAAIIVMREPTDGMMVAAENAFPLLSTFADKEESGSYITWRAMIDEALHGK